MTNTTLPILLYCESGLHAGAGAQLSHIDMPIQRSHTTDFPKIDGGTFKGAMREAYEKKAGIVKDIHTSIHHYFGYDADAAKYQGLNFKVEEKDYQGCILFQDVHLLFFPVKSQKGTFAWITCPEVYAHFYQNMVRCAKSDGLPKSLNAHTLSPSESLMYSGNIGLEEYIFKNFKEDTKLKAVSQWISNLLFNNTENTYKYLADKLETSIVVLDNQIFKHFVTRHTEVITRNKIDNQTGTVSNTGLFNEEYLPENSILYTLVGFEDQFAVNGKKKDAVQEFFSTYLPDYMQLGANETIGKGILKLSKTQ